MYLLVAKFLDGESTLSEQEQIDNWLREDAANEKLFRDLERLWKESKLLLEFPEFDTATAWDKVAAATVEKATALEPITGTRPFKKWLSIGAVAAAILLIALFLGPLSSTEMTTAQAKDHALTLELPDHTRVRLMAGSKLTYPTVFEENKRAVSLEGAAYFDVTRNEKQPFVVDANAVEVNVLGTSFYVTNSTKNQATVAVTSGKVRMKMKNSNKTSSALILTPGQKGVLLNNTLQSVVDTNASYYASGVLQLKDITLNHALQVLSQISNTSITVEALPMSVKQQLINISFQNQTLEQMLDELCLISHTRWQKRDEQYLILAK